VPFPTTIPALAQALADRSYAEPTPVQAAVLDPSAAGRDLLVSAQTGSGKTVAFGLAIAPTLFGDAETLPPPAAPLALIVAPTRELALQVCRELGWLYAGTRASVVSCVGGMDPRREQRALAAGAHIVVGTPGRLRDHLERRALVVDEIRAVVLDEADEMLDLGFRDDLEFILETTPGARRTLMFSATLPKAIASLAQRYQRDALRLEVAGASRGHADIEYRAVRVLPRETERVVVNLLRYVEAPSALVFCNTRETVRHLQAVLIERGFATVALSGELSQAERNHALQALRDGRARVCVATDVAARGIDLPTLSLVVHADLPNNAETLQHRSGRTGRAGRKGVSVLLVPQSRRRRAEALMAEAGAQPIWSGPPTVEEIRDLDQQRLMTDPLLAEESSEEDLAMARALLAERPPEEIAAALVRVYRSRLPAAEDVADPGFQQDLRKPPRQPGAGRPTRDGARRDPAAPETPRRDARHGGTTPQDGTGQWFRLNLGRKQNADPRWLLPMICRRGGVQKQDIGAIRIFDRETKFEVRGAAARRFAEAVKGRDGPDGRIEPVEDGHRFPKAKHEAGTSAVETGKARRKPARKAAPPSA
jgi:ATP-dependent RNA helicase DeaD